MSVLVHRPSSPLPQSRPGSCLMGEPWMAPSVVNSNFSVLNKHVSGTWQGASPACSAGDLSASLGSIASAVNGTAEGSRAPVLIPTPSMPDSHAAEEVSGTARSGQTSPFTGDEVLSIMRAEKLFGQLRHRFDCQPERCALISEVLFHFCLWLHSGPRVRESGCRCWCRGKP
jgi:hypothetical protein